MNGNFATAKPSLPSHSFINKKVLCLQENNFTPYTPFRILLKYVLIFGTKYIAVALIMQKKLIVLAGPTAVGKTELAIDIALRYRTEILSADSRQFYRELNVGTAKPDTDMLSKVKHHFINNLSVHDEYNAGTYERDALICLQEIYENNDIAVLCGGSGLFIDAVCRGFDALPEKDENIRNTLNQRLKEQGLESVAEELKRIDPVYAGQADIKNPVRVIRALEVYYITGMPYSALRVRRVEPRFFSSIKICLYRERNELYQRIDSRMDTMLKNGLVEEAKSLLPYAHLNALQTVGYSEVFDYLNGKYDYNELVRLLKRNSRRYAKRQLTWFRKDPEYAWFHAEEREQIFKYLDEKI
ncbi:MAG: tRNA (adenosine(37)-N6)-dimethylallyltransferase MiaA [Cytophagaceae bacterium]|nr:tRNA (adenosine(37)-N6)-dimethylallyltransferase MiaA [Cytophagaceae bacterium]MDW8456646.1 tRNA (adenosine(37)-N6)-dimethylallyltransferase MiaA [Cytophagaceae bacterium]